MKINGKEYRERSREEIEETCEKFIIRQMTNALQEAFSNGNIHVLRKEDAEPMLYPHIELQYWYSERTNKMFIEWDISKQIRGYIPRNLLKETINGHINANMRYDTLVWPEIVLIEDNTDEEKVDTNEILTAYTIGYWKCLNNRYEFLEDETEIRLDLEQYHTPLDRKPPKNFDEFLTIVKSIYNRYKNPYMTYAQKSEFIDRSYVLWDQYKDDLDTYNAKMLELEQEYHIDRDINNKIPEMFAEYKTAYENFFNRELQDVIPQTKRVRYVIIGLREEDEGKFYEY